MQDDLTEVNGLLARMLGEYNRDVMAREERKAQADPLAHKLSTVMTNTNYRYVPAGKDGRGRTVWFCWSSHRNVAGFYLGWREVRGKDGGSRDQWVSRRVRKRVEEIAERRAVAYGRRRAMSPDNPPLPPPD